MSCKRYLIFCFLIIQNLVGQSFDDYLPASFHENRRQAIRKNMVENSVAVFFTNPIRNRSNDVDYVYHQDPNFYYVTGFREPNAVLVIFSDMQQAKDGTLYDEIIFVPKKDKYYEMWNGTRMGVEKVKQKLKFEQVKTTEDFLQSTINYKGFNKVYVDKFEDDYRNTYGQRVKLYNLVEHFKKKSGYDQISFLNLGQKYAYNIIKLTNAKNIERKVAKVKKAIKYYPDLKEDKIITAFINTKSLKKRLALKKEVESKLKNNTNIDVYFLKEIFAFLREVKMPEELKLLTKAIRISAVGQIEVMKAMKPHMSEREIQGIHEFVYKRYGAEYEGYPSIVGAGNNGCHLHYIKNHKKHTHGDLVLMDLGAEYRGYTADVTRTIPANGKFSPEQKAIYEIVLEAQKAGIKACKAGNYFSQPNIEAIKIINKGLYDLGIIKSIDQKHTYLPHGVSHYLGLDVHDPGTFRELKPNSVITVEPGIYIPEGSSCDKKWWGIAVRIEDDILITKDVPVNLSKEAPRTVKAIEKMMAKKSVLNDWALPNLD